MLVTVNLSEEHEVLWIILITFPYIRSYFKITVEEKGEIMHIREKKSHINTEFMRFLLSS